MVHKKDIHAKMVQILDERISELSGDIEASKESRNTASKSSAGDKHETSRAMLQAELDNKEIQLSKAHKLRYNLNEIVPAKKMNSIAPGTLVYTSAGIFYISIALGKIELDSESVFAISPASPIGIQLLNSSLSQIIEVNNKKITILKIT